jgi:cytochrome c oxidase cbb3-type subunit 1
MDPVLILLSAFVLSVLALGAFIWSMRSGLLGGDASGATVIFRAGEIGRAENAVVEGWVAADRSSATTTLVFLGSAAVWLIVGSLAGLIASTKLHAPDWLASSAWLTFGRIRVVHLNAVAYGWSALAGSGLAIWMLPRLLHTTLQGARWAIAGAILWNVGLAAGLASVALGVSEGMEWLEMPHAVDTMLVVSAGLTLVTLFKTIRQRTVKHLYVSVWYLGLALLAFPLLFIVATVPGVHFGVQQAAMNWWYGHNVLGYFFTPLALASIYYFLPKVIGRPVQSYNLSLLGFWALAFFYGQVGGHHLIGGPVPGWIITLSIVQSVMMLVPVIAFSTNVFLTMQGNWRSTLYSPPLRFVALASLMYVLASVQGTVEAFRSVNTVTHFTHFTVAHAHLGLYGFTAMAFFGGIYFVVPRVLEREWPYPWLIATHFWLVLVGILVYVIALSIGGWLQGKAMLDPARPFIDSVAVTLPWLKLRTAGGMLMTLGHLVFVGHFIAMAFALGPVRERPSLFHEIKEETAYA